MTELTQEEKALVEMYSDFDYNQLTPGIRDFVRELHNHGFATCDSGDGVTNPAMGMEGAMEERHVFMMTTLDKMIEQTQRLNELYPDAWVELSWSPGQEPNIMILPDGLVLPPGCTKVE